MPTLPHLDAGALHAALPAREASAVIEDALRSGLDPEAVPPRAVVGVPAGQLLLMPAAAGRYAGVKVAGVAPGNPARGLPRITGTYLLLDGATLLPLAALDGPGLTVLRTAAVSAVAVTRLTPRRPLNVLVFGTGPQAWGHIEAVQAVRGIASAGIAGRAPGRVAALVERCLSAGLDARSAGPDSVGGADLVMCCTSAASPLFEGTALRDDAAVVAMGSHEPQAREVDTALVRRSALFVEARTAALRTAGDLVQAGVDAATPLVNLVELLTAPVDMGRPRLFKSVGMAWEDLAVAAAVYERHGGKDPVARRGACPQP